MYVGRIPELYTDIERVSSQQVVYFHTREGDQYI
jgi:hypothetical protein